MIGSSVGFQHHVPPEMRWAGWRELNTGLSHGAPCPEVPALCALCFNACVCVCVCLPVSVSVSLSQAWALFFF